MEHICRKTVTLSLSYLGVLLVFTSAEEPMLLLWVPVAVAASFATFIRHVRVATLIRYVRLPRIARSLLAAGQAGPASAASAPFMWNDVWTGRMRVVPSQEAA